ncbi:gliding motility-associated C-terminal domain-containing protein, partial [Fluviicola sp.]|uniref:T9SS type B sorting domain-containing protein n=1 Tax=Fluviicola sp. TaxID=1917219 RepID=UPI00261B857C
GTSTVTNYSGGNTYAFSPSGPTIGAGGAINGATPGTTYNITAGSGGCVSAPASFTNAIQLPTTATPTISTVPASCLAVGSGSVSNYNGGNTYTFSPSGPTIGAGGVINGATPGTSYTVTGNNGTCTSAPASFTIAAQLSTPVTPTMSSNPASCSSAGTSTVTNYSGGNTYTFSPSGPTIGAGGAINGATPGTTYNITAGSGGCTSAPASFTNAAQLPITATPTINTIPATCSSAGSGSVSNYSASNTYSFSPSGPTIGAGGAISGATPGTSYTLTGNNGTCISAPVSFTITTQPITPVAPTMSTIPASCSSAGTSAVTNYSAGNTYVFSPSGPTIGAGGMISGAIPGTTYSITTGNGGCTSTPASFTNALQLPATPDPAINTNPATCLSAGLSTITNYNAAYTYTFSPAGPIVGAGDVINGATPGTSYSVTATSNGCASVPVSFTNDTPLPVTPLPAINTNAATCSSPGSSTITNYNASYNYTFSPAGPAIGAGGVIGGTTPGTSYDVSSSNGSCPSSTVSFSDATQLISPAIPVINTTTATCSDASSSTVSNYNASYAYTFSPAGPAIGAGGLITGAGAGTLYTLSVSNGVCMENTSFTNAPQLVSPATPAMNTVSASCVSDGSSSVSNYDGSLTYTFTPAGPSLGASGLVTGAVTGTSYTIIASNGTCSSNQASFINAAQLPDLPVPSISTAAATCTAAGSSTIANFNGTSTYTFTPSGPVVGMGGVITGAIPGTTYTVGASDAGCTSPVTTFVNGIQLTVPNQPVTIAGNTTLSCGATSENYSVTTIPGVNYSWSYSGGGTITGSGSSITLNSITSGGTLTVIPSNACGNGTPQTIVINLPVIQLSVSNLSPSCANSATGSATVSATGGTSPYQYQWNPTGGTAATATNLAAGTYTVTVTDHAGCSKNIQVTITATSPINLNLSSTGINCNSSASGTATTAPFGGTSPYTYHWSNNEGTPTISNLVSGAYSVTVTDANNCQAAGTITVNFINDLSVTVTPGSATISAGDSIQLTAVITPSVPGSTYFWTPGNSLSCSNCPDPMAFPSETTTYLVTVTTPTGCSADTTVTISVNPVCGEIGIPNIFTPNGDQVNDVYELNTTCLIELEYWIVNRWGNTVFHANELNASWDGKIDSNPASEGVYFIKYVAKNSGGKEMKGQTFFHLSR